MTFPSLGYHPPRVFASAELIISDNAVGTALPLQNTFVPITAGWAVGDAAPDGMAADTIAGSLTIGSKGRYLVLVTASYDLDQANNTVQFAVFKNGVEATDALTTIKSTNAVLPTSINISGLHDFEPGDDLDLRVQCTTSAGRTVTVIDCNFSVLFIG